MSRNVREGRFAGKLCRAMWEHKDGRWVRVFCRTGRQRSHEPTMQLHRHKKAKA